MYKILYSQHPEMENRLLESLHSIIIIIIIFVSMFIFYVDDIVFVYLYSYWPNYISPKTELTVYPHMLIYFDLQSLHISKVFSSHPTKHCVLNEWASGQLIYIYMYNTTR